MPSMCTPDMFNWRFDTCECPFFVHPVNLERRSPGSRLVEPRGDARLSRSCTALRRGIAGDNVSHVEAASESNGKLEGLIRFMVV